MRRFASWQIAGIAIILTLFSFGLSGCFQTAGASPTETSVPPTPSPTEFIAPPPTATDASFPTAAPAVAPIQSQQAVAQNPTAADQNASGPEASQTLDQATLFAQATDILASVTADAAIQQTNTATAQGTGGPTPPPGATAAPGQVVVIPGAPTSTLGPQGTPGAAGSGAAGPITSNCIYTVVDGDRVYRIGLRFGVTPQTIAGANGIVNPDMIVLGQQLRIPNCFGVPTPIPTATTGAGTPTPIPGTVIPANSQTYVVQQGDTLFAVSLRYGVKVTALAQANNITDINLIYLGQTLIIP